MDHGAAKTPEPTSASACDPGLQKQPAAAQPTGEGGTHDFDAQKRIHQQIRNDPDYDDWEYGTEPLPHEAWGGQRARSDRPSAPTQTP